MSRNGGSNFEAMRSGRKLSQDALEAKLDLRRGSRTSPIDGKARKNNRRAQNAAWRREAQDA